MRSRDTVVSRAFFTMSSDNIISSLYIPMLVRGTALVLAFFMIPLEFIIRYTLSANEGSFIHWVQLLRSTGLDNFAKAMVFLGGHSVLILALPMFYNIIDPLITFKFSIVSCHLLYLDSLFAIIFKEPRPYWIHNDIRGINCDNGYGNPCAELLFSMVFYLYIIIELFEKNRKSSRVILYIIVSIVVCLIGFSEIYLGENFPHQIFFTLLLGYIYLTLVLSIDIYVSNLALISSFYDNKNRKNKIYWFVACMMMMLGILMLKSNLEVTNEMDIIWIKNAYKECNFNTDISGANSFNQSSWVFYNLGAVYGGMFASKHLPLGWWRSNWVKKVVRAVASAGVSYGIFYGFNSIPTHDNTTSFTFNYALNVLVCGFVSFGVLPVVFEKIKLNQSLDPLDDLSRHSIASGISMHSID